MKPRYAAHVTKRVGRDVTRLRRFELCKVLRRAFVYGCRKDVVVEDDAVDRAGRGEPRGTGQAAPHRQFRICQFSIQGNHIHLICEATDAETLARGIQAWSVRVARGLNGHMKRHGTVFADRYHVEVLRTPRQTRNALCYVLQNARRHGEIIDARFNGMDPFSSAWWFDGWKDESWKEGLGPPEERTVAESESWLLRIGWRRHGLLSIDEVPAAGRN